MAILLISSSSLFIVEDNIAYTILGIMNGGFIINRTDIYSTEFIPIALMKTGTSAVQGLAPLLPTLFLVALVAPMAVGGWIFSVKALSFKLDKLNLKKGMERIFSVKGLMELAKDLAKFAIIIGLSILYL